MSELAIRHIRTGGPENNLDPNFPAMYAAARRTLDLYESIVQLDGQRPVDDRIISRHIGAIAVIQKPADRDWRERVSGLVLFGDEGLFDEGKYPTLLLTKAINRAVSAENDYPKTKPDGLPPYEYLGLSVDRFSVGIAGPYPFHTELLLQQFAESMVEHNYYGQCQTSPILDDDDKRLIAQGHKGGNGGDAGDNNPEMDIVREPFKEYVEGILDK